MNCIKISINIICERNNKFNFNFDLLIPYYLNYNYRINNIIIDIEKYIKKKYIKYNLFVSQINNNSFIGKELNHKDYDWKNLNAQITDYTQNDIIMKGL